MQDINGYRNSDGSTPLPRVVLIVDEFQEFFIEEDKLAQDAALWLDRLVRQGRAFGIHVLLGSQSLSGAFSLARSTLGQMAVRIALQCSDTDAHLILSENNVAPEDALAPGEAIYNDANGAPEGNHFFQVVWLSDERREDYLERLHELANVRKPVLARTPIVFEGDAAADLALNPLLKPRVEATAWPESPRSVQAWLGDAIAIKDPTAALFRRLGGNHLLIVGQNEEAALGVSTALLIGLAAQYPPFDRRHGAFGAPLLRPGRNPGGSSPHRRVGPDRRPSAARGRHRRLARHRADPLGGGRRGPPSPGGRRRRSRALRDHPRHGAVPRPATPRG